MPQGQTRATAPENLLDVWITDAGGARKVGVLERYRDPGFPDHIRTAFYYDNVLEDSDAVSLTMPIRRAPYCPPSAGLINNLPPIFDQNLPEGALREYLTTRYLKLIPSMGDFDLAAITGFGSIGRVRMLPHGQDLLPGEAPGAPQLAQIVRNPDSQGLMQELMENLAVHSAVSGIQPKVLYDSAAAVPAIGSGSRATLAAGQYILKTEGMEFPWLSLNEYLCMQIAARSGLESAVVHISESGGMLIAERFDVGHAGVSRGVEDAATLSARTARQKYEGSYEQLVQRLALMIHPGDRAATRLALFKRILLSCVLGDGDAHLKNFALVYADPTHRARLSPAYDICSTLPYLGHDQLALSMGGKRDFPDHAGITDFGRIACLLNAAQVRQTVEEVAQALRAGMQDLKDYCDLYPDFADQCGRALGNVWCALAKRTLRADIPPIAHYSPAAPASQASSGHPRIP